MSLQIAYSVTIYRCKKLLDTKIYLSQDSMCKELRSLGAVFRNGTFRNLGDESVIVYGNNDFSYEVEELVNNDKTIEVDGAKYIPLSIFCQKSELSRRRVITLLDRGLLQGITKGKNNHIYIKEGVND